MRILATTLCLLFALGFGQAFAQSSLGTLTEGPKDKPVVSGEVSGTVSAARVNEVGRGRYSASKNFEIVSASVFTQPEYKGDPKLLDGLGHATAKELGLSGREVINEWPGVGGVRVTLDDNAELFYDAASREIKYLDKCSRLVGGKRVSWKNRVKLVEPPALPKEPEVRVEYRDRIVEKPVEKIVERVVEKLVEKIVYRDRELPCVGCPTDGTKSDYSATKLSRTPLGLVSSKRNFILSVFGGVASFVVPVAASGGFGHPAIAQGLRNLAYSAGGAAVLNAINPQKNRVTVTVKGERYTLAKGDTKDLPGGGKASWGKDGKLRVHMPDGRGGELLCYESEPGKANNIVVVGTWKDTAPTKLFTSPPNTTRPKTFTGGDDEREFTFQPEAPSAAPLPQEFRVPADFVDKRFVPVKVAEEPDELQKAIDAFKRAMAK